MKKLRIPILAAAMLAASLAFAEPPASVPMLPPLPQAKQATPEEALATAFNPITVRPPLAPKAAADLAPMPRELALCCGLDAFVAVQPVAPKKYPRGRVSPPEEALKERHADAFKRHGHRVKSLPFATPATFDCGSLGWLTTVNIDQANCGSCWDVSGCRVVTNAFVKAGQAKGDGSFQIAPQFFLDQCGYRNGGCNGDDSINILEYAKGKGAPVESDYGPYTARQQACKLKAGTRLFKISDWGYCTPDQSQGMASTQDIKNCLTQYGEISTAVVADSSWDGYTGGVLRFERSSPQSIDHDISIVGWDDSKVVPGTTAKGAWKCRNQWGDGWGEKGCVWIGYGSHQIGTEAAFAAVAPLPPPPNPPGPPVPPNPPTPGALGAVTADPTTGTITFVGPWRVKGGVVPSLAAELAEAGVNDAMIEIIQRLIEQAKKK